MAESCPPDQSPPEAPPSSSLHPRRPRPPDLTTALGDDNRVPLKKPDAGKMRRRESRLGLINLFNRQKNSSIDISGAPSASSSMRDLPSRGGGIRASLAEISNWPYSLNASRADIASPATSTATMTMTVTTTTTTANQSLPDAAAPAPNNESSPPPQRSAKDSVAGKGKGMGSPPAPKPARGALATWDPPPLFQAYPQAIRHIELPACTMSAESILRMHSSRGSATSQAAVNSETETTPENATEWTRRKHRRNASSTASFKSDWTTKIYVLVTSGYLLQYAGDGSFDRLPEKILQLGKDSAAFASDLIPGRHWVVQVSAAMEADGTSTADSRSLLSRLPFRVSEKRQASLFLMVFPGAEEMDHWIAILRREIEHLGGKKNLSETGKPKMDDSVLQMQAQPSQRTLVVRDPDRFSRAIVPEQLPWGADLSKRPDVLLEPTETEATLDQSFDDVSTTNSTASHDGRQLDSLREGSHRLSFISSGQRTMVTSEDSSPAGSPVRDSFSSHYDEPSFYQEAPVPEVQPRPNAQAILERRMSMQTVNPRVDVRIASKAPPRPSSTCQPDASHPYAVKSLTTPNFSVPHSVGKRFSLVKTAAPAPEPTLPTPAPAKKALAAPPRPFPRRPPPPSLAFSSLSRPLSVVADQPSPLSPQVNFPGFRSRIDETQRGVTVEAPDSPAIFEAWGQRSSQASLSPAMPTRTEIKSRRASLQVVVHTSPPRRHESAQAPELRAQDMPPGLGAASDAHRPHTSQAAWTRNAERSRERPHRSASSLDSYERPRSPSRSRTVQGSKGSRRSGMFQSPTSSPDAPLSTDINVIDWRVAPPPPMKDTPPTRPLPRPPTRPPVSQQTLPRPAGPRSSVSTQHLRVESDPKTLLNRHSMPQLAGGPPPAPPPTCALPPIPPRFTDARASRIPSIKI